MRLDELRSPKAAQNSRLGGLVPQQELFTSHGSPQSGHADAGVGDQHVERLRADVPRENLGKKRQIYPSLTMLSDQEGSIITLHARPQRLFAFELRRWEAQLGPS